MANPTKENLRAWLDNQNSKRASYNLKCAIRFAERLLFTMQENEALKLDIERSTNRNTELLIENELALNSCAELASELSKVWAALRKLYKVSCDFEQTDTPELSSALNQAKAALSNEVSDDSTK